MRLLLILFTLLFSQCLSFPIPTGQIIKYRVSSKYFNRQNATASSTDNSLYQILSQMHYGTKEPSTIKPPTTLSESEQVSTVINESHPEDISDGNKNNDSDVTTVINSITNQYPETVTTENTDESKNEMPATEQPISMDVIKINSHVDNNDETELIEKVSEEKLATEVDLVTTEASSDSNNNDDDIMIHENDQVKEEEESNEMTTINDAVNFDFATENNKMTDDKIETNSNDKDSVEDETDNESKVPESLLSAVGDLLSSVLGINVHINDDQANVSGMQSATTTNNNEHQETSEVPSEQPINLESTVSNTDEELLPASVTNRDHNPIIETVAPVANEVDLKIENLANVETSFVTENTPEVYAEHSDDTVKEQSQVTDEVDDDKIVLETLSELTAINNDGEEEPVSFEDSVNHVMNLVRATEGKLALENVVDSILIDKHIEDNVSDLDQIVYGTLKEIETNLGLNGEEEKNIPSDSFNPIDLEREEMIKNFETDINESLRLANPDDVDYESLEIEPNPAKAAMYYKFQYGDDF